MDGMNEDTQLTKLERNGHDERMLFGATSATLSDIAKYHP
jgi:hypothetical protein